MRPARPYFFSMRTLRKFKTPWTPDFWNNLHFWLSFRRAQLYWILRLFWSDWKELRIDPRTPEREESGRRWRSGNRCWKTENQKPCLDLCHLVIDRNRNWAQTGTKSKLNLQFLQAEPKLDTNQNRNRNRNVGSALNFGRNRNQTEFRSITICHTSNILIKDIL